METEGVKDKKRMRRRYSKEEKRRVIRGYRESGLTQREFCEQNGVSLWNLRKWLSMSKGQSEEEKVKDKSQGFVEVETQWPKQWWAQKSIYRLGDQKGGGWLEVESGFDAVEVKALYGIIRVEEKKECK